MGSAHVFVPFSSIMTRCCALLLTVVHEKCASLAFEDQHHPHLVSHITLSGVTSGVQAAWKGLQIVRNIVKSIGKAFLSELLS